MTTEVLIADYQDPEQQKFIGDLMNEYACDPMGGGEALPLSVQQNLAIEMAKIEHAFTVIAMAGGKALGLINCFQAFSTFKCQPLINIHDVIVSKQARGSGIAQQMLNKVDEIARQRGCCKVTLEVLEGNTVAQQSYLKSGFAGYELDPEMGKAMFWQKIL